MTRFSFFASQLFNWRIVKYAWYVEKIMVLLCELSMFSSFFTISSTKINNLNKFKVSKIDANKTIMIELKVDWICLYIK
jgi:hypothetical protein